MQKGPSSSVFSTFEFENCFAPPQCALFRYVNSQTWSENGVFLKHFDFDMCFAPQQRALFRHLNFEKWSDMVCFTHFDF